MKYGLFSFFFFHGTQSAVYSASKKYVYYFGKVVKEEIKKEGINVMILCPGNMDTEMNPRGKMTHNNIIFGYEVSY